MNWPTWQEITDAISIAWNGARQAVEGNLALQLLLLLGLFVVIMWLGRNWFFAPAPEKSGRIETQPKKHKGKRGTVSFQPNETNGMEHPLYGYPLLYRFTDENGEEAGRYLKKGPGPEALLRLGNKTYRVDTLRQLTEEQIELIETALKSGKRFLFQLGEWQLVKSVSLNVEVLAGSPPYFPGKKGMIDYKFAFGKDGVILLENPYIPNKPTKLRTWTSSLLERISLEEFEALSEDVLEAQAA